MKMIKLAFPRAEETKGNLLDKYQKEFEIYQKEKQKEQEEEERRREEHRRKLEEEKRIREEEEAALEQERKRIEDEKAKQITEEQHRLLEEQKMALKQAEEQQKILQQQRAAQIEKERMAEMEKRKPPVVIPSPGLPSAMNSPLAGQNTVNFNSAGGVPSSSPMPGAIPIPGMVQPSAPPVPNDSVPSPSAAPQVDRSKKIDRSSKPNHLMQPTPAPINHYGLRDVFVPLDAVPKFLAIAKPNTGQNLETCGILAGKLARNAFSITHIVIPKQTSTSDSCTALNEEEIFDCMDNNDLVTLGWIHTHPTQTAFMSSIDLHTHCPYQIMLSEAIAIVCAPAHNETGVFSLTPDYGLNYIASCKEKGFHPHPKHPSLYEELNHVKIRGDLSTVIKDLR
ncbi:STAM-binding protein-like isoform X3 [Anneissia japonica]|nr:STAM-binding protein-like isoform X3 [Anneissia japonica]